MQLTDWLDAERGRAKALAEHLKRSEGAVTHWRTHGVPLAHVDAIVLFTGGEVTRNDLIEFKLRRVRAVAAQQAAAA